PVAELCTRAAAVESPDERLAVLIVPEADAGGLAPADRSRRRRPLAEVVVQGVQARREVQVEYIERDGASGRADAVSSLRVAGRLTLPDRVAAGEEVEENVGTVGVGGLAERDGVAQKVGAVQGDRDPRDTLLAEVHLAVVVEIGEDQA